MVLVLAVLAGCGDESASTTRPTTKADPPPAAVKSAPAPSTLDQDTHDLAAALGDCARARARVFDKGDDPASAVRECARGVAAAKATAANKYRAASLKALALLSASAAKDANWPDPDPALHATADALTAINAERGRHDLGPLIPPLK